MPGAIERDGDGAGVGADRRLDDVLAIVLVRARDVAGQGEARAGCRSRRSPRGRCRTRACRRTRRARRAARQTSWTRFASCSPPTRLTLMLITRQAPRSIALRASSAEWMLSSRQIGVSSSRWSRAWSMMSSWASGCSISRRFEAVELAQRLDVRQVVERVAPNWRRPGAGRRRNARGRRDDLDVVARGRS